MTTALLPRPTDTGCLAELFLSEAGDDIIFYVTVDEECMVLSPTGPATTALTTVRKGPGLQVQRATTVASPDDSLQVPATTRVASPEPGHGGCGQPTPAPVMKKKNYVTEEESVKDNLETPLVPTPVKPPVKKIIIELEEDTNDELDVTFGGEVCKVCKVKCRSVGSLQEHILTKHCTQSSQVMELLKMQQQLLNTVLANQAMQEKIITNVGVQQDCVIGDLKDLKKAVMTKHMEKQHDSPRGPSIHQRGHNQATNTVPSQATQNIPPQEPPISQDLYAARASEGRPTMQQLVSVTKPKKIAYITDSIGGKVHVDLLKR